MRVVGGMEIGRGKPGAHSQFFLLKDRLERVARGSPGALGLLEAERVEGGADRHNEVAAQGVVRGSNAIAVALSELSFSNTCLDLGSGVGLNGRLWSGRHLDWCSSKQMVTPSSVLIDHLSHRLIEISSCNWTPEYIKQAERRARRDRLQMKDTGAAGRYFDR